MLNHQDLVTALSKSGVQIIDSLTPEKVQLLHMAVGIAGEAGELLDAIKKHVFYESEIDRTNIIEDLGDLEFYMEGVRQEMKLSRETTLKANIAKLNIRYENGFSNEAAQERADKK